MIATVSLKELRPELPGVIERIDRKLDRLIERDRISP